MVQQTIESESGTVVSYCSKFCLFGVGGKDSDCRGADSPFSDPLVVDDHRVVKKESASARSTHSTTARAVKIESTNEDNTGKECGVKVRIETQFEIFRKETHLHPRHFRRVL